MSHLPMDIVEEILFRVPAISLKRLGSTCKQEIWVTNNIDTEAALWIKSFTVDLETCSNRFLMAPCIFYRRGEESCCL